MVDLKYLRSTPADLQYTYRQVLLHDRVRHVLHVPVDLVRILLGQIGVELGILVKGG